MHILDGVLSPPVVAVTSGSWPPPGWNLPLTVTHWSRAGPPPSTPTTRTTTGAASAAQHAIW